MDLAPRRTAARRRAPSRRLPALAALVALLATGPAQAAPREAALAAMPATTHAAAVLPRATLSDATAAVLFVCGLGAFVYARRRDARLARGRWAPAQRVGDGVTGRPPRHRRLPAPATRTPAEPRVAEHAYGASREAAAGESALGAGWTPMSPAPAAEPAAACHAALRTTPFTPR